MNILRRAKFALKHPIVTARYVLMRDIAAVGLAQRRDRAPDIVQDLDEYLQLPRSVINRNLLRGQEMATQQWRRMNPQTPEEVREFYEHCVEYIYDLAFWHTGNRYQQLLDLLKEERGGTCLSFGGGIGTEALRLAAQGNLVWYCDIPGSPVWRFAEWRARRRNAQVHFTADIPTDVLFDCIVAFDVFEHLTETDLVAVFSKLVTVLKPGGRLYCENSFGGQLTHPMHFNHRALWDSLVAQSPLEKVNEHLYVKSPDPVK